jgi:hypothetical protein
MRSVATCVRQGKKDSHVKISLLHIEFFSHHIFRLCISASRSHCRYEKEKNKNKEFRSDSLYYVSIHQDRCSSFEMTTPAVRHMQDVSLHAKNQIQSRILDVDEPEKVIGMKLWG